VWHRVAVVEPRGIDPGPRAHVDAVHQMVRPGERHQVAGAAARGGPERAAGRGYDIRAPLT
jgi:hypothetical protein